MKFKKVISLGMISTMLLGNMVIPAIAEDASEEKNQITRTI